MPHKCIRCGKEYKDASLSMVKGCTSCGGKKFLFVRTDEKNQDVLQEKPLEKIVKEKEKEVLEIPTAPSKEVEIYDRVESVRIVAPGTYELNIEKMAKSDERVVSVGNEGHYVVDLLSMVRSKKKKGKK
jgi:predicted  nucleic acid-binding Zn-ribbon protein